MKIHKHLLSIYYYPWKNLYKSIFRDAFCYGCEFIMSNCWIEDHNKQNKKKLKTPMESLMESIFHWHLCRQFHWNVRTHSRTFIKIYRMCKNFSTKSLMKYSVKKINGDEISDSFQKTLISLAISNSKVFFDEKWVVKADF